MNKSNYRASLIRRADASVTALNSRINEPFYCSLDQDAARVLSDCVDMLEVEPSQRRAMEPVAMIAGVDEYGPRIDWYVHWAELGGANLYAVQPAQQVAVPAPMADSDIDALGVSGIENFPNIFNRVPWGNELRMYVRQLARAIEVHHKIGAKQ